MKQDKNPHDIDINCPHCNKNIDFDYLLNKYGPEGLFEIADKLKEIAIKDVNEAMSQSLFFPDSKPMEGKEYEVLKKTASRLISDQPTTLQSTSNNIVNGMFATSSAVILKSLERTGETSSEVCSSSESCDWYLEDKCKEGKIECFKKAPN